MLSSASTDQPSQAPVISCLDESRALLELVARGDPGALARVFTDHARDVYRVAYGITLSADDADDVVQDVFIGLPEALRHYDERGRFSAWLRMVAARTALMRRRAGMQVNSALNQATSGGRNPEEILADRLSLETALRVLPEDARAVFVLKVIEGYTHDEISAQLGIRRGTSEVRLFRAIRRIREMLAPVQEHRR